MEVVQLFGYLRQAQVGYYLEYGNYSSNIQDFVDQYSQIAALKYFEDISLIVNPVPEIIVFGYAVRKPNSDFGKYGLWIPLDDPSNITCNTFEKPGVCEKLGYRLYPY